MLCESNLDGKIANLNQLTTTGNHNITCTLTNANNRSISISKEIKVTYDEYKITNLIINGSFENDFDNWSYGEGYYNPEISNIAYHGSKGAKLISDNEIDYSRASSMVKQILKDNPQLNHKYYAFSFYKSSKNYTSNDNRFEWYSYGSESCRMIFGRKNIASEDWVKTSTISTPKEECLKLSNINWAIRNFIRKSTNDVYIDSMVLIDLTNDFGEDNEPTLDWLDKHISYFDDTISIYK